MKRICRSALFVMMAFIMVICAVSCSGGNGFVGTWTFVVDKELMSPAELSQYGSYLVTPQVIEINKDGTGTMTITDPNGVSKSTDVSWKANGDRLITTNAEDVEEVFVYKDGRLYRQEIMDEKPYMYFVKK